jgi:hypothetical protein
MDRMAYMHAMQATTITSGLSLMTTMKRVWLLICIYIPMMMNVCIAGFQLEGASSNNTVLYLDSYMNRDPRKNGESADGFACKEGSGTGNVLRGARLWNNVDDGLDLWYGHYIILNNFPWLIVEKGVRLCRNNRGHSFMG